MIGTLSRSYYIVLNICRLGMDRLEPEFGSHKYIFAMQNRAVASPFCIVGLKEPEHDKTNKMTCALSEDSDQPGHAPSLIRVLAVRSMVAKELMFLHAYREYFDQTGRMPRLI